MKLKLLSWNVNGIRALHKSTDFVSTILKQDYDIIGLQEIKAEASEIPFETRDYFAYYNSSIVKKGYSGTAIFSKAKPLNVMYGFGKDEHDQEGRLITLEYDSFYFITVYTPNSKEGLLRLSYRMIWENEFKDFVTMLAKTKPVIICGDLNVAHEEIDLKNPKQNERNPGFTLEERSCLSDLLKAGFIDTFRTLYPNTIKYSWWSYRFFSRQKGIGWRIDYFLTSASLRSKLIDAKILDQVYGSDHCPVTLEIDL
ncbi:MAG: exodeoxyribonuclease III [Erysipelotrichaceae bacterium]|jgi:exodeoxyribonuclease-3|nr:exodeoxyribonuclease III [Erysipelotrichaceae bacterium]